MNTEGDAPKEHEAQESRGLLGGIRQLRDRASEVVDQATGGRLRPGLDATKEKVSDVGNTVTGKKIQQQIEDFTDVVSTAVIGVHRDQRTIKDSLTQLQVQQTGLKLDICEIRGEQSKVKETLSQVQAKQKEAIETLSEVQRKQDTLTETLEQLKKSLRRIEQPYTRPWWQFWNWRWI
jgi:uncharacterized coiled-coil DUF342 family protein